MVGDDVGLVFLDVSVSFLLSNFLLSDTVGIRAGMFVRNAKALCPHLVILPYNFEAYEEVIHK